MIGHVKQDNNAINRDRQPRGNERPTFKMPAAQSTSLDPGVGRDDIREATRP